MCEICDEIYGMGRKAERKKWQRVVASQEAALVKQKTALTKQKTALAKQKTALTEKDVLIAKLQAKLTVLT